MLFRSLFRSSIPGRPRRFLALSAWSRLLTVLPALLLLWLAVIWALGDQTPW